MDLNDREGTSQLSFDVIDVLGMFASVGLLLWLMNVAGIKSMKLSATLAIPLVFVVPLLRRKFLGKKTVKLKRKASAAGSFAAICSVFGFLAVAIAVPIWLTSGNSTPPSKLGIELAEDRLASAKAEAAQNPRAAWQIEPAEKALVYEKEQYQKDVESHANRHTFPIVWTIVSVLMLAVGLGLDYGLTRRDAVLPEPTPSVSPEA